jgi:Putative peptidase (DUF1758)
MPPLERLNKTKALKLCINCLKPNHMVSDCGSISCRRCKKRHHTLLHLEQPEASEKPSTSGTQAHVATEQEVSTTQSLVSTGSQVLLSTILLIVDDQYGKPHYCRALLDSGSQSNFICEEMAQTIGAKRQPIRIPVSGISQKTTFIRSKIQAKIRSRTSNYLLVLEFLVLPRITGDLPSSQVDLKSWKLPSDISLADPQFQKPQRIDMLLGAEIFFDIWTSHHIKLEKGLPTLRETFFGWVVAGKVTTTGTKT